MKKNGYLLLSTSIAAITLIIIFFAHYSIGVVEKSSIKKNISQRIDKIVSKIDKNETEAKLLTEQISSDYEHRTQIIAMMLNQTPKIMENEVALEELRSLIDADEISITNDKGVIIYTTNQYEGEKHASSEFMNAISDKNFSKTVVTKVDEKSVILSAVSRIDSAGIVQISFTTKNMGEILRYTDIGYVTSDYPLMIDGCTAVIDKNTHTYLSHTNSELVGTPCQIDKNKFTKNEGNFYSTLNGKKAFVYYRIYNGKIILGMVPRYEVFTVRNSVTAWLIVAGIIINIISVLSYRTIKIKALADYNGK